jgi:transcription-repair coupling factor (superfamily II helicase)
MSAPLSPLVARWRDHEPFDVPGSIVVPPQARAFFLAGLAEHTDGAVLAIVPSETEAEDLAEDVGLFTGSAHLLPAWETLPFEHVSPNLGTMAARAEARHALTTGRRGTVVVGSVRGVVQRVSPSPVAPVVVSTGDTVAFDDLIASLAGSGYERTDRVEGRGQFAVRGGIVDVYPGQGREPARLDFWGDTVTEITAVSVASQRSVGALERMVAFPVREVRPDASLASRAAELMGEAPWAASTWERIASGLSFAGIESWLPWLAPAATAVDEMAGGLVVLFEPPRARDRSADLEREEVELAEALAPTWGVGAPEAAAHPPLFLSLADRLTGRALLEAPAAAAGPGRPEVRVTGFDAVAGDADSVASRIRDLIAAEWTVVVAMDGATAADRVAGVLAESGLALDRVDGTVTGSAVVGTGVHRGFLLPGLKTAVLGERELAGRRRSHRRPAPRAAAGTPGYHDLQPGDYVVHRHHGIGRFEGLVTQRLGDIERDYLLIAYAGHDRLYVPTDQLEAVRKYGGGEAPRLSKMGGADWERTRGRVRVAVAAVADEVVALHRQRARVAGHAFGADTPWQREMEEAFPFEETPDQLEAVADVKADMEQDAPMDRLVFGDVGFGKTEVAIRAVFKAVQDGKQAAVLVPTTLLAQQHHQTFSERLAPYPVRVEVLSRFLTPREQRSVIDGVRAGSVDVVIGTHRLLSDDVEFRDLGLLVVDEEQRFGVGDKDRIRALRASVDVLTLTATPIPRTLEMALTGIRGVSRIATPPEDRHPILTFVGPYDDRTVSAAIRRELLRDGQVFYVHNRVQSIDHAVARIQSMVPDARIAVAHGRMDEGRLEQVMLDFWSGAHDVLVATTIIESGLDLPQVNTLIVERADLLGLAQLYQLRGRVGRSSQRAYAYLFHPQDERLSEEAYRRLEAIGEFGDLGSGFQLAMRDLEIRGAGSILGNVQSGHVAAVGFDLYVELVSEAVEEMVAGASGRAAPPEVRIELPVEAHLPDEYVTDQDGRLEAYRRLAAAMTLDAVDDVAAEWVDRYGPLPRNADTLIEVARLRVEAMRLGIGEIVAARREVRLTPVTLTASQEVRLERLAPKAVLRRSDLFLPLPTGAIAVELVTFLRTMWPPDGK